MTANRSASGRTGRAMRNVPSIDENYGEDIVHQKRKYLCRTPLLAGLVSFPAFACRAFNDLLVPEA
jgi:hypothetical protein